MAAVLVYSEHTKSSGKRIVNDRLQEVSTPQVRRMKEVLEHPKKGIKSLDVRSNAATGGSMVPLMGPAAEVPLVGEAATIAAAHGIDAKKPRLPRDSERSGVKIARAVGRCMDLVLGIDTMLDRGHHTFLQEINGAPVVAAYVKNGFCDNLEDAFIKTRLRAVDSWRYVR